MLYLEFMKRFDYGEKIPLLHPVEDMEIEDSKLNSLLKKENKL